jgi:hypothetical protein
MPQRKTQRRRHTNKRRHTKKAMRKQTIRRRKYTLTGGSAGCEQAATIMEPGFTITSYLKGSTGLTIPSSRALLSGTMPSCNKGSHP